MLASTTLTRSSRRIEDERSIQHTSSSIVPLMAPDESQTQPETQLFVPDSQEEETISELKRKDASLTDTQDLRKTKKAKISIGAAVDLGD